MTRKRVDGTEITGRGHAEIRPVYREEFGNRGTYRDFAEWAWHLFLDKCVDYIVSDVGQAGLPNGERE